MFFNLADYGEVKRASIENRILRIDLAGSPRGHEAPEDKHRRMEVAMNVQPFDPHRRRAEIDDDDPPRPGMRLPITEDQDPATAGSLFAENFTRAVNPCAFSNFLRKEEWRLTCRTSFW